MKRKRQPVTLWEAAVPKDQSTKVAWMAMHGNTNSANAITVLATGAHEGIDQSDLPTPAVLPKRGRKEKTTPQQQLSTYIVGLCLTKMQRVTMTKLIRIEKAAFTLARHLYMRTRRGMHTVAWNSCDAEVRDAARAAKKGQDGHGQPLEDAKAMWARIQKVVVSSSRDKTKLALGDEDADILPPTWYYEGCVQPQKGGLTRLKGAVQGCFKTVRTWSGGQQTVDWDAITAREGAFLVQHTYCQGVTPSQVKRLPTFDISRRISIIPAVLAGRREPKTIEHASERFVKVTTPIHRLPPFNHDLKVVKVSKYKFRLHIPCAVHWTRPKTTAKDEYSSKAVCALDPGARTFVTAFDGTRNVAFQYGTTEQRNLWLQTLLDAKDSTQMQLTEAIKKQQQFRTQELKHRMAKLNRKLADRVKGVHRQLTGYLARRYAVVVVGHINVCSIVRKVNPSNPAAKRKIGRTTTRHLLAWSHAKFRDRLKFRERADHTFKVIIQEESFTSKTCGRCNTQNKNLGGAEHFDCRNCGYSTHRDINGARNILRKALGTFPTAKKM